MKCIMRLRVSERLRNIFKVVLVSDSLQIQERKRAFFLGCSREGYCLPFGYSGGEASVHLIDHAHFLNFIFLLSIPCTSKLIFFSLKAHPEDMRKI